MKHHYLRQARARAGAIQPRLGLLLAAVVLLFATVVYAVHDDGLFELDVPTTDATNDPGVLGDDAENIYCAENPGASTKHDAAPCAGKQPSAHLLVSEFDTDPVESTSDTIPHMGQTKDHYDFPSWHWTTAEPNDKNDIGNVFVSIYKNPADDHYILYFGLDVFAPNGDADIGFWFLQNEVAPVAGGNFSGVHADGDVLVEAKLVNGGRVGEYFAYTWNNPLGSGTQYKTTNLYTVLTSTDCDSVAPNDASCARVNGGSTPAPWPYQTKGVAGDSLDFPQSTYFEAGLDLTALFPRGIPCLQSYIAETRNSQSVDATLEDFKFGTFDVCNISVSKTGPEKAKAGDEVTYTIKITNNGALPLQKQSIDDSLAGDLSSYCGAVLNPGDFCEFNYDLTVPSQGAGDPYDNTVTVVYGIANSSITKTASHSVDLFTPGVSLSKSVNKTSVYQGESVTWTIMATNTGSSDSPDLACTLTDALLDIDPGNTDGDGDVHSLDFTFAAGGSKTLNIDSGPLTPAIPSGAGFVDITNTAYVSCSPANFPNVLNADDDATVRVRRREVALTVNKTGDENSKAGDDVNYSFVITNTTANPAQTINLVSIIDNRLGNLVSNALGFVTSNDCGATLAAGASCTITATRQTQAGDSDPYVNMVTVMASDAFGNASSANDSHSVDLHDPDYTVASNCLNPDQVFGPGATANFNVVVTNTGDVQLNIHVDSVVDGTNYLGGGSGADITLGAGAQQTFEFSVPATADGTFFNDVSASATLDQSLGLPNIIDKTADSACTLQAPPPEGGDATRTLGFWKTHGSQEHVNDPAFPSPVEMGYTCHVAEDHPIGYPIDLGWKQVMDCGDLMGIFWSNMGTQSTGGKRDQLCKTSLHASWQLLAAILNTRLDNGLQTMPDGVTPVSEVIDALKAALLAGDRKEIIKLQGQLDEYNNFGDNIAIVDEDGAPIPHADPNGSRFIADYSFGDCGTSSLTSSTGKKPGR